MGNCSTNYHHISQETPYKPFNMMFGLTYSKVGFMLTPKDTFCPDAQIDQIALWFHFHNFYAFIEKERVSSSV